MRDSLKQRFIAGCDEKIEKKGDNVGLSFYAFFKNKNDDPELLMEAPLGGSKHTSSITLRKPLKSSN